MAIVEVKVPQLSESVAEATLLKWKKKAGEAGDAPAEIHQGLAGTGAAGLVAGVLVEEVEEGAGSGTELVEAVGMGFLSSSCSLLLPTWRWL